MARRNKTRPTEPVKSLDDTGKLLIRAQESIESFDQQLEESRSLAREVRRELKATSRRTEPAQSDEVSE